VSGTRKILAVLVLLDSLFGRGESGSFVTLGFWLCSLSKYFGQRAVLPSVAAFAALAEPHLAVISANHPIAGLDLRRHLFCIGVDETRRHQHITTHHGHRKIEMEEDVGFLSLYRNHDWSHW
jgi:hypothetical protein